jgi:PKD repeat protein
MKTKSLFVLPTLLLSSFMFMACPGSKTDEPEPEHTGAFSFSATNDDLRAPAELNFTPEETIENASYIWDFGDGTTTTDPKPKKVFTTGGTKTVRLSVTAKGITKTETKTLTVDNPYTKVRIKKSTILNAAQAYSDGTGWDISSTGGIYVQGGPDVYIIAKFASLATPSYTTAIKTNVTASQLTNGSLFWEHTGSGILLSSNPVAESDLRLELRDADMNSTQWAYNSTTNTFEPMGAAVIKLSDYMTIGNKYPTLIELKGATTSYYDNALKIRLDLVWEN